MKCYFTLILLFVPTVANQFKAISDEGMPMHQRLYMRGKVYIQFIVEFRDSLSPEQLKALEDDLITKTSITVLRQGIG